MHMLIDSIGSLEEYSSSSCEMCMRLYDGAVPCGYCSILGQDRSDSGSVCMEYPPVHAHHLSFFRWDYTPTALLVFSSYYLLYNARYDARTSPLTQSNLW